MSRRSLGLLAAVAAVAATSSTALAAGPANVTVRVEGDAATLVPRTALTTTTTAVSKDGDPSHGCPGTSAAGALEQASGGDWSGTYDTGLRDYAVERILGETHTFADPSYWGFFVNDEPANSGVCNTELNAGDTRAVRRRRPPTARRSGSSTSRGVPRDRRARRAVHRHGHAHADDLRQQLQPDHRARTGRGRLRRRRHDGGRRHGHRSRSPTAARRRSARPAAATTSARRPSRRASPTAATARAAPPRRPPAARPPATTASAARPTGARRARRITSVREGQRFARGKGPRDARGHRGARPVGHRQGRAAPDAHRRAPPLLRRSTARASASCGCRAAAPGAGGWFARGHGRAVVLPAADAACRAGRYVLDVRATDGAGNTDTLLQRTPDARRVHRPMSRRAAPRPRRRRARPRRVRPGRGRRRRRARR